MIPIFIFKPNIFSPLTINVVASSVFLAQRHESSSAAFHVMIYHMCVVCANITSRREFSFAARSISLQLMSLRTRGAITVAARHCTRGWSGVQPPPPSSVRRAVSFCISAHGRATTFWDHLTTTSQFRATLLDHTLRILLCHAKMRFMRRAIDLLEDSPW